MFLKPLFLIIIALFLDVKLYYGQTDHPTEEDKIETYFHEGKFLEALKLLEIRSTFNTELSAKNRKIYSQISSCYLGLGNLLESLRYAIKSLELSELHKDVNGKAESLKLLGNIYLKKDEWGQALDHFREAYSRFKALGDYVNTGQVLNNMGIVHGHLKHLDSALFYFEKALEMKALSFEDSLGLSTQMNIAYVYFKRSNYREAAQRFLTVLDLSEKSNDLYQMAICYGALAELYLETLDLNSAKSFALIGLSLTRTNQSIPLLLEFHESLCRIYQKTSNFDSAFYHLNELRRLGDSLNANEEQIRFQNLKALYNYEVQKQEISALEQLNRLNIDILIKKNQIIVFLYIGLSILLILLFLIGFQRKKIKNQGFSLVRLNLAKRGRKAVAHPHLINENEAKYKDSNLSLEMRNLLVADLNRLFQKDKIFLDQDLTLIKLAKIINCNKSYVSQVINEVYEQNFNAFVNEARINEAIVLLSDVQNWNLKIEYISRQAGFKSKSVFNKEFKQETGLTPSEYIRLQRQKRERSH